MDALLQAIAATKKYATLSPALVRRVAEEEAPKFSRDKERLKAVKNRLHQIYGAYFDEAGFAKAEKLLATWQAPEDAQAVCQAMLGLHASTRERMGSFDAFYSFVRTQVGPIRSALDLGCGLHPFALPLLNWPELEEYHALDIDARLAAMNNELLARMGLPRLAAVTDAVSETPNETVDVAFLLKLLPVLENQQKGRASALLRTLRARRMVVSFPARSLSGRDKGMARTYAAWMESALPPACAVLASAQLGQELVYILGNGD